MYNLYLPDLPENKYFYNINLFKNILLHFSTCFAFHNAFFHKINFFGKSKGIFKYIAKNSAPPFIKSQRQLEPYHLYHILVLFEYLPISDD